MNSQTRRNFLKSTGLVVFGTLIPQRVYTDNIKKPKPLEGGYKESRHFWTVLNGNHCEVKQEIPISGEYCGPEVKLANYKIFSPTATQIVTTERYNPAEFNPLFHEGGLEEFIEVTNPNWDFSKSLGLVVLPNDSYYRFYTGNEVATYNKRSLDENPASLKRWEKALYDKVHLINSDILDIRRFRRDKFDNWRKMLKSLRPEQIQELQKDHPLFMQVLHADKTEYGKSRLVLYNRELVTRVGEQDHNKLREISKKISQRTKKDEVKVMIDNLSDRFEWQKYL